ncbi:uncharacterized protein BDZ99DRAFT_518664 [Mytilinidion resinicola]|uniref:Uncharacterized protein n=1 Tax=Mytilinidion resinicola TaxID=574789 RepID=A0A6A6YTP0_9PEZI|nr:uncharacterized protein BDZ99DRAFT_518664 [Mytilinidion resinicola]KAF2811384.1 hypothetical protein BDZ99DRAFT_518664 [Mytilinidion resinicola]
MGLRTKLRERFKRKKPIASKSASPSAHAERSRNAQSTSGSLSVAQLDSFDALIKSVRHNSQQDGQVNIPSAFPHNTPSSFSKATSVIANVERPLLSEVAVPSSRAALGSATRPSLRVAILVMVFLHRVTSSIAKDDHGSIVTKTSTSTPSSTGSTTTPSSSSSSPETPCPIKRSSSWPTPPTVATFTGSVTSVDTGSLGPIRFTLADTYDEKVSTATVQEKVVSTDPNVVESYTKPWAVDEPGTSEDKISTATVSETTVPSEVDIVDMYSEPWGFEPDDTVSSSEFSDNNISNNSVLPGTEGSPILVQDMTLVVRAARRCKNRTKRIRSSAKRQITKTEQEKFADVASLMRRWNKSTEALKEQLRDVREKSAATKEKDGLPSGLRCQHS